MWLGYESRSDPDEMVEVSRRNLTMLERAHLRDATVLNDVKSFQKVATTSEGKVGRP
jgi:hypothetical protein